MNFNYKVYQDFHSRQINIGNPLGTSFFQKKIIKSCFDSVDNLFLLRNNFHKCSHFFFSDDGDYLVKDEAIMRIKDDFYFDDSCKIMELPGFFFSYQGMAFNKGSSKFFFSRHDVRKDKEITVVDLLSAKIVSLFQINSSIGDISSSPFNPNIFTFNCDNGNIYLNDLRSSILILNDMSISRIRSLQFNPINDNLILVTSQNSNGVFVLDLRNYQRVMNYNVLYSNEYNISNGCYNKTGNQVLLNRYNSNPLLFHSDHSYPVCEFDEFGFFNCYEIHSICEKSMMSKNSCFVGPDDEYVAVSSSSSNVYVWEIPKKKLKDEISDFLVKADSAKFILKHSSRVDFIQYNHKRSVLGCSENCKSVKFWSPFEFVLNSNYVKDYFSETNFNIFNRILYDKLYQNSVRLNQFIACCFFERFNSGLYSEYFMTNFKIFDDIQVDDFSVEFKKDLNIVHIKFFILNYEKTLKYKNSKILKQINEVLQNDWDFILFFKEGYYLSLFIEIFKLYLLKKFLLRSIKYLNHQYLKVKTLKNQILSSKKVIQNWKRKLCSLMKIKVILISMIVDLKIILLEDKNYIDQLKLLKSYFEFFYYNPDEKFENLKYRLGLRLINNKVVEEVYATEQKISSYSFKKSSSLKIFDQDMDNKFSKLKKKLKIKKQKLKKVTKNSKYLNYKVDMNFFRTFQKIFFN